MHASPFRLHVAPGPAAATTSTAQGAGLVRAMAGAEAACVITSLDAFGNRRLAGGAPFRARLSTPAAAEAARVLASCEVVDCEDGTFLALYTPPPAARGACELHVMLGEAPLKGSPFKVEVG